MAEEKPMKPTLGDELKYESLRNGGEPHWRPQSRGKYRWPITALAALFSVTAWWLFAHNFFVAQIFLDRGLSSEATRTNRVTRQYNLTVGARWMNLGETANRS